MAEGGRPARAAPPVDLATFLRQIEHYRATYTVAPPALLTTLLHNEARACWPGRQVVAAHARLRLDAAGGLPAAGLGGAYGIEIVDFSAPAGASRCSAGQGHPRPGGARLFFPRYGARSWLVLDGAHPLARIVEPATGAEITAAGVPGELRIKGRAVSPGYLRASGAPDPFDEDGYLKPGNMLQIASEGPAVPALRRAVPRTCVVHGGME